MASETARHLVRFILLGALLLGALPSHGKVVDDARALLDQGLVEQAVNLLSNARSGDAQGQASLELALLEIRAYRELGDTALALGAALSALRTLEARSPDAVRLQVALGDLYVLAGQPRKAIDLLKWTADSSPASNDALLVLGNSYAAIGAHSDAISLFSRVTSNIPAADSAGVGVRAWINLSRSALALGRTEVSLQALNAAYPGLNAIKTPSAKWMAQLAWARLGIELLAKEGESSQAGRRDLATAILDELVSVNGEVLEPANRRFRSYAFGYLGRLYEVLGRTADAALLTERALALTMGTDAHDQKARWFWQLGRVHVARDDLIGAIAQYRSAVGALERIKGQVRLGQQGGSSDYEAFVAPIHVELADLLLRASERESGTAEQSLLLEARNVIERMKAAELEDYFRDDCVTSFARNVRPLEQVSGATAVLYHIPFPDRLAILLSTEGGMFAVSVPVKATEVSRALNELRRQLERTSVFSGFFRSSRRLYDWMIKPIESELAARDINTLVLVPQREFLLVPPGALHDGKQFLVEKYALAVTPGLSLTDPKPFSRSGGLALLGGLSVGRDDFSPLTHVPEELEGVGALIASDAYQDDTFTVDAITQALQKRDYSIIHLATHAQFDSNPEDTFLLAFDGRLSVDRLDRLIRQSEFRDQPVELLTLSACETAAGDYRTALGLAGIGIKAGARSALATLWPIQDEATVSLIRSFYDELLGNEGVTKAEALRRAQRSMLKQRKFRHPGLWSPFLMVGNWL